MKKPPRKHIYRYNPSQSDSIQTSTNKPQPQPQYQPYPDPYLKPQPLHPQYQPHPDPFLNPKEYYNPQAYYNNSNEYSFSSQPPSNPFHHQNKNKNYEPYPNHPKQFQNYANNQNDQKFFYLTQDQLDILLKSKHDPTKFINSFISLTPMKRRLDKTRSLKKLMIPFMEALKILIETGLPEVIAILADCFDSSIFRSSIRDELDFYQSHQMNEYKYENVLKLLNNLHIIFMYIIKNSREIVQQLPVSEVTQSIEMLLIQKPNDRTLLTYQETFKNLDEVTKTIKRNNIIEKMEEKKQTEAFEKNFDFEINYKEVTPYPTEQDCLQAPKKRPYFPHIIKGPYPSLDLYLNNMFHLLKDDFMIGIRKSFQTLKGIKEFHSLDPKILEDTYLYKNVTISDVIFGDNGVYLKVILTPFLKNAQKINWMSTKRMNFGSLMILTDEMFESMFFATVFDKPKGDILNREYDNYGDIEISIKGLGDIEHIDLVQLINDLRKKKLMIIEARTYFEAYHHFLKKLQTIQPDTLPFEDIIIKGNAKKVDFPSYLKGNNSVNRLGDYVFRLNFQKNKGTQVQKFNILEEKWPRSLQNTLDDSQFKALQNILTRNFSIIQGPPGTGKTFVGALAIKILLDNKEKWNSRYIHIKKGSKELRKPLLVVAYTNHALDQFLNHVLKFTDSIARLGGRSNDPNIMKYSLMELRKTEHHYTKFYRELKETIRDLEDIKNFLIQLAPLNLSYFFKHLPENQQSIRKKELVGALLKFGVDFVNPLNKKSMEILFKHWRDGTQLNMMEIKGLVKFELNQCENRLIEEKLPEKTGKKEKGGKIMKEYVVKEEIKENIIPFNNTNNIPNIIGDPTNINNQNHIINNIYNNQIPNNNNENEIPINDIYNQIPVNNYNDSDYNEEDLSDELEDPNMEDNRRIENDLEEYEHILTELHSEKSSAKLFFTQNDYVRLKLSNYFINKNLWDLTLFERNLLINYCFMQNHEKYHEEFKKLIRDYKYYMEEVENSRMERDLSILRKKKVVGVTVSGCAKFSHFLERLESPITIIEEAAEVLETHTISVLTKYTQHLILIGDHQQLKPHVESYDLEKKFNFNVSLFERMTNNEIPYVCLQSQRRMRPEFADFIRIIYPQGYLDHESVLNFENIKGVKKNLFFFNHNKLETENPGLKSKSNPFEANIISNFVLYLIKQNYKEEQITILSMYIGQTLSIKGILKKKNLGRVKVATVDNYQGEENDIILISLVRSNKQGKLGFVKIENRICVALSRAKKGMYIFGNFDFIFNAPGGEQLWRKILTLAKDKEVLGDRLNLSCQNHNVDLWIKEANDFKNAPEGGCTQFCNIRMDCGHMCRIPCHNFEHSRKDCIEICNKEHEICKHRCPIMCRNCEKGCGDCYEPVEKILPCGHSIIAPCSRSPKDIKCKTRCPKIHPSCRHQCSNLCGEPCEPNSCPIKTNKTLLCGHKSVIKCSESLLEVKCESKCTDQLPCGHNCSGTCHKCFQGTLHYPCQQKCKRDYICGHLCTKNCSELCGICEKKCDYKCCEALCDRKCGQPCFECKNKCSLGCKHRRCERICSDPCDRLPCDFPCEKILECEHPCIGICGEACLKVCKVCEPENETFEVFFGFEDEENARFYALECGHVFERIGLDKYMGLGDEEVKDIDKAVQFKTCPKCKRWIMRSSRYQEQIKKTFNDISKVKGRLVKESTVSINEFKVLERKVDELLRNDQNLNFWKKIKKELEVIIYPKKNDTPIIMQTYYNFLYLIEFHPEYDKLIEFLYKNPHECLEFHLQVKVLGNYYLLNYEVDVNNEQWEKIRQKLSTLTLFAKLRSLCITSPQAKPQSLAYIQEIIKRKFSLNYSLIEQFTEFLESNKITREEQIKVIKALNLSSGHIFTCPNGHFYAIGECGGAMEVSRCPECNSQIGGSNHLLVAGNRHSGILDGSNYAAFSDQANMHIGGNLI